jgi:hypothetical protein
MRGVKISGRIAEIGDIDHAPRNAQGLVEGTTDVEILRPTVAANFTTPWSATITYGRSTDHWPEMVCAENPHQYYAGKDAAVPTADKPDF